MTPKDEFQKQFPFISCIKTTENEYVGIIINLDDSVASIYDFSVIRTEGERKIFLEMGDVWWWESNRSIPINIFLRKDWEQFRYTLRTFVNQDLEILHGPACSLLDIARKKTKRKSITLVRRLD